MRRLLLLRHAKAERLQSGGSDWDRVLADRGWADAKKIGAYLAKHSFIPDRALVSTAARTRETWAQLATAFSNVPPVSFEDSLYNALPAVVLQEIRDAAPATSTLLVVGHNPAMHELAVMLTASGNVDTRARLGEGFPTSALAAIAFATGDWSNIHSRGGRLEHFVTPASLAAGD